MGGCLSYVGEEFSAVLVLVELGQRNITFLM